MKPFDHDDDALKQLFQTGGNEDPPLDFSQSVMDRIQAKEQVEAPVKTPSLRPRRLIPMHWVAAACVAVLFFLAFTVLSQGGPQDSHILGEWTTSLYDQLHLPHFSPYLVMGLASVVGLLFLDRALRRFVRPQA